MASFHFCWHKLAREKCRQRQGYRKKVAACEELIHHRRRPSFLPVPGCPIQPRRRSPLWSPVRSPSGAAVGLSPGPSSLSNSPPGPQTVLEGPIPEICCLGAPDPVLRSSAPALRREAPCRIWTRGWDTGLPPGTAPPERRTAE